MNVGRQSFVYPWFCRSVFLLYSFTGWMVNWYKEILVMKKKRRLI